jgi:hypothetical protein
MDEEADYNRIVRLTEEKEGLERAFFLLKDDLTKAESALRAANDELKRSTEALDNEKEKARGLHTLIKKLEKDIDHERAAAKDAEGRVEVLYTDLDQSRFAHRSALADRDEALADQKDLELQLEDLKEQWHESEERIAALEAELEEAQKVLDTVADGENDIAMLRDQMADQERTIMIKDERISHLEMQVQKERQRVYHNADAIARSHAASPVDEDQHIGAIGDSLEAELSAFEEDFYEVEWNEFSHITETPLTYSPIAPAAQPPSTLHTQQSVSISPVAARIPRLTLDVREAGRLEPREPAPVASHTISINAGISTAPVTAAVPTHTLIVREAASTGPIEPARAPLSSIHTHEIASFAPKAPAPGPQSTLNEHQLVSIVPRKPGVATLTVSVREAGSTIPTVHRISTTDWSTQTELALLTSEFVHHATVSTAPSTPVEVATAESPTQTDGPVLASQFLDYATVSTAPVAPVETIIAQPVQSQISDTAIVLDLAPVAPTMVQRKLTTTVAKGTQTLPESASPNKSNEVVSVMTTHEIEPVEQVIAKVEAKHPTASTGIQTLIEASVAGEEEKEEEEELETVQAPPPQAMPATVSKSKLGGASEWIPIVLNAALAFFCLYLYIRLNAWQTANGVGLGGGRGNMASRSGAYGNGRYLFGLLPVGMNVGDSWWTEQIARHTSSAVSRFEDWAGIAYEPLY